MAQFEWVETFVSIEGEATHSGTPTVYVRFTKCNFECRGFHNPEMKEITNEVLGFDPANYIHILELPPIQIGCDSIYAWDDRFKHMWKKGDTDALIDELEALLPGGKWVHPVTHQPVIFSLTGGEPTLRAKFLPELLNHPRMAECRHVLVETNCSVPLTDKFITAVAEWMNADPRRKWTWSNSPKLACSGEKHDKAIRPDIALKQFDLFHKATNTWNVEQYFKFVVDGSDESFDEVERVMAEYWAAGIPKETQIHCMPMACVEAQQQKIAQITADKCIERGMRYCHRVHATVYENAIGK
jgi:6-pyruvoyltetrahydropterin 2'-reductase